MSCQEYWDGVALLWRRRQPQRLWRRHCDAVHEELLRRWLGGRPAGRVLKTDLFDEAFGGGLLAALSRRGGVVVGVDVSPRVVEAARARHRGLEAAVADVRRLPFEDASFDAAVSDSTLDHFDSSADIAAALGELARVLRPGGRLLLTLDNPANPLVWLRNRLPLRWLLRAGLVPYRVGATAGRRRLAALVRGAGLRVAETAAILHCPRVLAVAAARALQRRPREDLARGFLRVLGAFEALGRWPSRYLTGHFVAVAAVKPPAGRSDQT